MTPAEPSKPEASNGTALPVGPVSGNGHLTNGHLTNGHLTNGHLTNGHAVSYLAVERAGLPTPAAFAPPANALNAINLLRAFRRRWALATFLGLFLAAIVGVVTWYFVPPSKYTVRTVLRVHSKAPYIVFPTSNDDFATYQRNQAALVKHRFTLTRALRDPQIANLSIVTEQPKPVEWLEQELMVDFQISPEFLRISMSGDKPDEMIKLLDAIREAYFAEFVNVEEDRNRARLEELKSIAKHYEDLINEKKRVKQALAEQSGSGNAANLQLKHKFALEMLASAQKELLEKERDIRAAQVELAAAKANQKRLEELKVSPQTVDDQLRKTPVMEQLFAKRDRIKALMEDARVRASDAAALERQLSKHKPALEEAEREIKLASERLRPEIEQAIRDQTKREILGRTAALEERLTVLVAHRKMLADLVENQRKSSDFINTSALKQEDILDEVSEQAATIELEMKAPARIVKVEPAAVASSPDSSRPYKFAGMAAAGTLALAMLLVSLREFHSKKIDTADEVALGLGVRVMGALPQMPGRRNLLGMQGLTMAHWQSLLTESVDATRTMLMHAAKTEGTRVIMVTSAMSGEGKTSLASHLATSLARAKRKTLLIDCDLRRPAIHRLLDIPAGPGFCELLRGEAELLEVVRETSVEGLSVMAAGRCSPLTLQALTQDGTHTLFEKLREQYEFVIIDTSPILAVADSLLLGQHVDGVLFAILRDVSRLDKVYAAYQKLTMLGIKVLGVVVNGASADVYGTGYHHYYTALQEAGR
jgi:capsular exopolysaccharide synthesis family protein